jgi:hypothetical protein
MSVVASKSSRLVRGSLMGALLGLGLLLGGCVENGPDVDGQVDTEQVGDLDDALLEGEIVLDDVDGDGDIDSDDIEELLLDLQEAAGQQAPGSDKMLGAPDEGHDPSPQPWTPGHDGDPEKDADAKAHLF